MRHLQAAADIRNLKVYVYYNLHKGCFSLKALEGEHKGRVVYHASAAILDGCTFKVSEAGRQRVIKEQKKNVHAGIVGRIYTVLPVGTGGQVVLTGGDRVSYNPYKYSSFITADNEQPIAAADRVYLNADKSVYAAAAAAGKAMPESKHNSVIKQDAVTNETAAGNFHLTVNSKNAKTGNMAVSTSNAKTCPDTCPLKDNGCYADNFHLKMHWDKVSSGERGVAWPDFLQQIKTLPARSAFRHDQAGDLSGRKNRVNSKALQQLTRATKRLTSFTYTHYPVTAGWHKMPGQKKDIYISEETAAANRAAIKAANAGGFAVNISANSVNQVDEFMALETAPVAVLMPADAKKVTKTAAGNKVVMCPAQTSKKTTCSSCLLCANSSRDYAIGFYPHGSGAKKANSIAVA
jgi:hypothetical protein